MDTPLSGKTVLDWMHVGRERAERKEVAAMKRNRLRIRRNFDHKLVHLAEPFLGGGPASDGDGV